MSRTFISLIILAGLLIAAGCSDNSKCKVTPFDLSDVTLLDGPFKKATELNIKSLLSYEPDRLLSRFRSEAGLKPKAEAYKGWEAETIAGHSLGHYLSACALMYQTTKDKRFLDRAKYIVDELEECQAAEGNGYVGAIPNGKRIFEEEIANGDIRSQGFDLNGLWSPFYTYHKLMAGLRDAYELCGIDKALEVEKKFGDWVEGVLKNLSEEQVQEILRCEYGGMNEAFADLYNDTGERKYLHLSELFTDKIIIDSLAAQKDVLPDKHANTQIPKIIGLARRYELTGSEYCDTAAEFFWNTVVHHHTYVTGGNGNREYFGQPDKLSKRLSDETTETCNVYNMLKLSRHLFEWSPKAEIADFYELALLNHILASQNPENGRVTYNLSLEMGGYKYFQDPEDFTCCIGTGMENHSKYGGSIYFKDDNDLYVSQFIASSVDWKEKGLTIVQTTKFPEEQGTVIEIEGEPTEFTLFIRYPYWAQSGMKIKVNGDIKEINEKPQSFIPIKRKWANGDKVEISFPFTLRMETMPDDTNRFAVMYGPLVMAGILGPVDDPAAMNHNYVPVFLTEDRNPADWMHAVSGETNTFAVDESVTYPRSFIMVPFYTVYDKRYSVYWDMFSNQEWKIREQKYEEELKYKKELESKTIDFFQPGEMQPERNHNFTGEKVWVENFKHSKGRTAGRGGWLSFELAVDPSSDASLVLHYWGGFTGHRAFDILVNGQKIATEDLSQIAEGEAIDKSYLIGKDLMEGKDKILVKLLPHDGHRAGPFFGARTILR